MASRAASDLDAILQGTPFRAVARLGRGGMGEIYEARGPFGGVPVVVKVLRADLADQEELGERLRREGELLQWLSHPNIVVSHGHGTTAEGRPYVVLERLVGSTLRQELTRRGALPLREAVVYTRQLLAALGAVHRAGLVHRDVKPGNVMVCSAGSLTRLKLLDFGVAKVAGDARRLVGPIAFPTREGVCLGTPRYFSPEQASGLDVDRRTDIYAAGMLLYTLLAGRGPFDDVVGVDRLLEAHIATAAPPPSRFMSTPLDRAVEAVVLRAIAKNPADRFDDVASFGRELGRASRRERDTRRTPRCRFLVTKPYPQRATIDRCLLRHASPRVLRGPYEGCRVEPSTLEPDELELRPCPDEDRGASNAPRNDLARRAIAVGFSAAAFFALAGRLAMWFVR
jgi:serine/threonine-protein kinase